MTTLIDEAGRLIVIDAEDVTGLPNTFVPAIRDIAGNLLRTNQDEPPFSTVLVVDLPAPLDFGDAPDPTYQTLLSSNGARHVVVPNIRLGAANGAELDALPSDPNDDGVSFLNELVPSGRTPVEIVVSTEGFIDAWVDVDGDGRFDEPRDRVLSSVAVTRGSNTLRVPIPADAQLGATWSRFRFSTQGGLNATGRANDGEVEDYAITIADVVAPTATDDTYGVDEDQPLTIAREAGVLANDTSPGQGDPTTELTAIVIEPPGHGTLTLNEDGSFDYEPDLDFNGTDTFQYQANSDILGSNIATVTIEIAPQPDPPVAGDDQATTKEDTPTTINLVANDVDPDGALVRTSIVITQPTSHGTVEIDDEGLALYSPDADYFGTDTFQYTIDDAEGATSNAATVTITVTSVNDVPIAVADEMLVRQGTSTNFDLLANDYDVDGTLNRQAIVITQSPKSGTIRFNADGTIIFTPDPTFLGIDTFSYTVRDNQGATSNRAVVTVNVSGQNQPPVAGDDTATTDREQPVTIDLIANDSDPEGQLVSGSISISQAPGNGSVTLNLDGTADYQPATGFVGVDTFRYTIRDDLNLASNVATVTVTVNDLGSAWQNKENPLDVNADGFVVPLDALLVINEINANGSRPLDTPPSPTGPETPPPYLDVNGDEFLSPLDALLVINELNNSQPVAATAATWSPATTLIGAALDIQPRVARPLFDAAAVEDAFDGGEAAAPARVVEALTPSVDDSRYATDDWLATDDGLDETVLDLLAGDDKRENAWSL